MAIELDAKFAIGSKDVTRTNGTTPITSSLIRDSAQNGTFGILTPNGEAFGLGLFPSFSWKIGSSATLLFFDEIAIIGGKANNDFGVDFRWSF
jgi:hypothetical protein